MKLHQLELINFGIHNNLKADLNGPVIGILGKNGTGKSTLLESISFAITGILQKQNSTYINRYQDGDRPFAEVRLSFSVKGKNCEIRRRLTPTTTKHTLKVDGDPDRTKLSEVDTFMTEVLKVDKKAIATATFIRQGTLDRLFFNTRAEREETLSKLLQIGHLHKVDREIMSKLAVWESEITDHTLTRDSLLESFREAQSRRDVIAHTLTSLPDYADKIKLTQRIINSEGAVLDAEHDLNQARVSKSRLNETLNQELAASGFKTLDEVSTAKGRIEEIRASLKEIEPTITRMDQLFAVGSTIQSLTESLRNLEAKSPEVVEDGLLDTLSEKVETQEKRVSGLKERVRLEEESRDIIRRFAELQAKLDSQDVINANKLELDQVTEELNHCNLTLGLLEKVKGSHFDKCPVCQSSINSSMFSEEAVEKVKSKHGQLALRKTELAGQLERHSTNQHALQTQRDRLNQLTVQKTNLPNGDLSYEEVELKDLRQRVADTIIQKRVSESHMAQVVDLKQKLDAVDPEMRKASEDYDKDAHLKLKSQFNQLREEESQLYNKVSRMDKVRESLASVEFSISEKQQAFNSRVAAVKQLEVDPDFEAVKSRGAETGNIKEALEWYENRKTEKENLAGQLSSCREEVDRIVRRLAETEADIEKNATKVKVAGDLKRLASAFRRDGIGSMYTAHVFGRLATLTQQNLENLDANFSVLADPDEPVSFIFTRTDRNTDSGIFFHQDDLSGGQKVRLAIAFLIAIQQTLVSEVGLLVLDEPTTHLDASGRYGIRDFLKDLHHSLENSDYQVIVCDHEKELETAMKKVIHTK